MDNGGSIIIIKYDQEILNDIFKELAIQNKVIFFVDGEMPLKYLTANPLLNLS